MENERLCKNCGTTLGKNAKFCSECGMRIENVPLTKPVIDLICEKCGSSLEVSPNDQMVALCPHCGHKHIIPMNRSIRIQQIKSDIHKEIELNRQEMLRSISEREQSNREKEKETHFLKWMVGSLLARSGMFVGTLFCLLSLVFDAIRPLLLFGLILIFIDVVASKFIKLHD